MFKEKEKPRQEFSKYLDEFSRNQNLSEATTERREDQKDVVIFL